VLPLMESSPRLEYLSRLTLFSTIPNHSPRLSAKPAASWFAMLLLCASAGLSCEVRRTQRSQAGSVQRIACAPKVASGGAGGFIGATAGAVGTSDASAGMAGANSSCLGAMWAAAGANAAAGNGPMFGSAGNAGNAGSAGSATLTASHVERAILVSVDGLGAKYIEAQFAKGKLPAFAALRELGSSTLNARSDYDDNYTLPNHTTILTGRPVNRDIDLPADVHHGWTINGVVDASVTLHNSGNPLLKYIASVFDVAHDWGKRTCMYAGKPKFSLYSNSYDAVNGAPDTIGVDNGRNKLDRVVLFDDSTELLMSTVEADLSQGLCDFVFIHIADLDTLGHALGWGSDPWIARLDLVDGWLERLSRFTRGGKTDSPFGLVVTADHGGGASGHGDPTDNWNYQIPFFAVGPGYAPNTDLYEIANGGRCDPGLVRPRYSNLQQPVRNADAANAVLAMLGLPPVPGSLMRNLLATR